MILHFHSAICYNVNCLRRQLFLKKLHTKSCTEFYWSMRDCYATLLLKEITQKPRILFMYSSLASGMLKNVTMFIITQINVLIIQSSCIFAFKIKYAFENLSIILMEKTLLPCAFILQVLVSFDVACCNFAAALKKVLFSRSLITHTFNLIMARVN